MILPGNNQQSSQPLKWHGGKYYLASRIIERMPKHTHYVEPFFGGGAVFLAKPRHFVEGHSEVVNDVHGDLITFWRVLQGDDSFSKFRRLVEATPFAKPVWQDAYRCDSDDPVVRAAAFFVRFRQSRQGLGKDFATMSRTRTRRGMNEQVSSWLSAVSGLAAAHERLRRVAVFCEDAATVIRREDSEQTFFYCDPPYVHHTRTATSSYDFEMSLEQHAELLETLGNIRGTFLLSGYLCPSYDEAATRFGWNRLDILIDNKASSQKIKPRKTECLWSNY